MEANSGKSERVATSIAKAGGGLLKIVVIALLVYVVGMTIFAISKYSTAKSTLLSYGLSDATGTLIAWTVMLVAIGIPGLAIVRLFFFRGRPYDYAAVMLLPLISWGMVQIPANFDAVTGAALKFCASRPDNTLFCLDRPGIDPITQKKLVAMNPNIAELEFRRNKGLVPKRITQPVPEISFFDPLTAEPRVWVRKNDQDCFDLFDHPGVDTQSGERLLPITKEVVRIVKKCGNSAARSQERTPQAPIKPEAATPEIGEGSAGSLAARHVELEKAPEDGSPPVRPSLAVVPGPVPPVSAAGPAGTVARYSEKSGSAARYVDTNGCLREANGSFVIGFRSDCK